MSQLEDLDIDETHPLISELSSLRVAVSRFQDEAYSSSVKLQRHSLDAANNHDRVAHLERENEFLKSELAILRANPHPDSSPQAHPAALQVQQLTLSLRRLSDKLSLTEAALLERTTQLAHATGESAKAKLASDGAYELAARTRGREEAAKIREVELEWKVKAAEEAVKMSDLVVNEYADLVRSLETKAGSRLVGESHSTSSITAENGETVNGAFTLTDSLSEGKLGLQRLLSEFSTATEKLQTELIRLHGELAVSESKREAEKKSLDSSRMELANAQFELQRLKLEDNTAAKMVSRYMKFSQKSTDMLQDALTTLKTRHAAAVETLSAQLFQLSSQLQFSESQKEKLRGVLDDLGGEIMKETYGRRREVALRIRMVNREEKMRAELERWVLRSEEAFSRDPGGSPATRDKMVQEARAFLTGSLGGSSGSLARLISAQNAVEVLSIELERETAKRLELTKLLMDNGTRNSEEEMASTSIGTNGSAISPLNATSASMAEDHHSQPPALNGIKSDFDDDLHPSTPSTDAIHSSSPISPTLSIPPTSNRILQNSPPLPHFGLDHPRDTENIVEVGGGSSASLNPNSMPSDTQSSQQLHDLEPPPPPITDGLPNGVQVIVPMSEENVETDTVTFPPRPETPPTQEDISHSTADPILVPEARPESGVSVALITAEEPPIDESIRHILPHTSPPPSPSPSPAQTPETHTITIPTNHLDLPAVKPHALLDKLHNTKHRYDDLQRAFRDCHLALEALTKSVTTTPNGESTGGGVGKISPEVLRTALQRLSDYTEDARVELEIRISDELLMARGFEALLSVPGALSSSSMPSLSSSEHDGDHDSGDAAPTRSEVELQVEAFISGEDDIIQKSHKSFSRKLEDVQHDIAALKRAIHDDVVSPSHPLTAPATHGSSGWTSWIRNSPSVPSNLSPRSAHELNSGPAPTFGSVMTSPRLRHSPSLNFPVQSHKRMAGEADKDPFASLGLKVPMPSYVHHVTQPQQRARTVSTMYMLGLGARRPSGSFPSPGKKRPALPVSLRLEDTEMETNDDADAEVDDIE